MSQRRFGVEIEFGTEGSGYIEEHRCECGCGQWVGESYGDDRSESGHETVCQFLRSERLWDRGWDSLGWDGSELELRSPILQGPDGFAQLKAVMDGLVDMGCWTGEEDGLHVHHDAPEFVGNRTLTALMLKSWVANRDAIYGQLCADYRDDHWACPPVTQSTIREYETDTAQWHDRYDLNYRALDEHGTFEFRCHEGTINYNEAEAWIMFGQTLIDNVAKRSRNPITTCATPAVLLKRIKAPAKVMKHYRIAA